MGGRRRRIRVGGRRRRDATHFVDHVGWRPLVVIKPLRVVVVDELVVGAVARDERDLKQSGRERRGVWEIGAVDLDQV